MPEEITTTDITSSGTESIPDERFEAILREFLPFLPADEPLTDDVALREFGLDSMGTVELLATLESTYDVRFQNDALSLENFANPGILRQTLTQAIKLAS